LAILATWSPIEPNVLADAASGASTTVPSPTTFKPKVADGAAERLDLILSPMQSAHKPFVIRE